MLFFYESNSFDPRKNICSVDNDVGDLVKEKNEEENCRKPLEFESPSKGESEEMPKG